jgi:hypothetical protein
MNKPIIDYEIALIILPTSLFGSALGTMLNKMLPDILLMCVIHSHMIGLHCPHGMSRSWTYYKSKLVTLEGSKKVHNQITKGESVRISFRRRLHFWTYKK